MFAIILAFFYKYWDSNSETPNEDLDEKFAPLPNSGTKYCDKSETKENNDLQNQAEATTSIIEDSYDDSVAEWVWLDSDLDLDLDLDSDLDQDLDLDLKNNAKLDISINDSESNVPQTNCKIPKVGEHENPSKSGVNGSTNGIRQSSYGYLHPAMTSNKILESDSESFSDRDFDRDQDQGEDASYSIFDVFKPAPAPVPVPGQDPVSAPNTKAKAKAPSQGQAQDQDKLLNSEALENLHEPIDISSTLGLETHEPKPDLMTENIVSKKEMSPSLLLSSSVQQPQKNGSKANKWRFSLWGIISKFVALLAVVGVVIALWFFVH